MPEDTNNQPTVPVPDNRPKPPQEATVWWNTPITRLPELQTFLKNPEFRLPPTTAVISVDHEQMPLSAVDGDHSLVSGDFRIGTSDGYRFSSVFEVAHGSDGWQVKPSLPVYVAYNNGTNVGELALSIVALKALGQAVGVPKIDVSCAYITGQRDVREAFSQDLDGWVSQQGGTHLILTDFSNYKVQLSAFGPMPKWFQPIKE